ncbi:hypothetical protein [Dickeya oryzae]
MEHQLITQKDRKLISILWILENSHFRVRRGHRKVKSNAANFFWLEYEPSWNAVVYAREHGGCLTASLELNEITSFSVDKSIGSNIKAKMLELKAHVNFETSDTNNDVYYISATFSPTVSDVV